MDKMWIHAFGYNMDTSESTWVLGRSETLTIDPTPTPNAKILKKLTDVLYQMQSRLKNTINYKGKSQNWPNGCRMTKAPRTICERARWERRRHLRHVELPASR